MSQELKLILCIRPMCKIFASCVTPFLLQLKPLVTRGIVTLNHGTIVQKIIVLIHYSSLGIKTVPYKTCISCVTRIHKT